MMSRLLFTRGLVWYLRPRRDDDLNQVVYHLLAGLVACFFDLLDLSFSLLVRFFFGVFVATRLLVRGLTTYTVGSEEQD